MLDKGTCLRFYKRKDIQDEMVKHALDKEVGMRYGDGFGRRPDAIMYPKEVVELALKGVTSFHVSEELWTNPLSLSSDLSRKELDELRKGWDLVLDIDCKFIDYSKICADLIIQFLKYCEVKDIFCKFSVTGNTPLLVKVDHQILLKPIKDVVNLVKGRKELEVLSLNKDNNLCFSKITGQLHHQEKIFSIYHDNSRLPLEATGYHSVFVWENSLIIQKEVSALKPGDFLVTFRDSKSLPKRIKFFEWEYLYFNKKKKRKVKITTDISLLLGYYLAEGHLTKTIHQVGFSFNANEKNYIDECVSLLKKITRKKISIRNPHPTSTQVLIHSKEWYYFFEKACGKGAKNKHLPEFVWELPQQQFKSLLINYLRGDGYKKGEYSITAKSVSHQLIKELAWACQLHGISCSINEEETREHMLPQGNLFKGSHVYSINIPKSELIDSEFFRERNKFSPYPKSKTFPVDGLKLVYQQTKPKLFNSHRTEQMTLSKKSANMKRIRKVIEWFDQYKSVEYNEHSKKIIRNYLRLDKNDLMTLEVKNIIKNNKKIDVYDVSVKGTERFFGGNYPILLHNSGNKGFHIGVSFQSFPEQVGNLMTKQLFPEAAKKIAFYIKENIKEQLAERIMELEKNNFSEIVKKTESQKEEIIYYQKSELGTEVPHLNVEPFLEIDTILISSRHLYRMPYSLHEKSGLVSLPIDPDKVMDFQKEMAHPDKILTPMFGFLERDVTPGSARRLLVNALDFEVNPVGEREEVAKEFAEVVIESPIREEFFPPCVINALNGLEDGKKRAVFILTNFLGKLGWKNQEIKNYLLKWNREKNQNPLRDNYIVGQMKQFKAGAKLPPNCSNDAYYKGIGICKPERLCKMIKNPVNNTILKWKSNLREKEREEGKVVEKKE